ncbi:MAG: NAD-dependent protein deacetylase [Alkalispirochaetaceae bacterium]
MAPKLHTSSVSELAWLLRDRRTLILTGAGISTDSGIPDYRGPQGSLRKRSPVTYSEFIRNEEARRRYWARSTLGWPLIASVKPNPSHIVVARLEATGLASGVVTQNVDGLHRKAGSTTIVELHGNLSRVLCLDCGAVESRHALQNRMLRENRRWNEWQVEEAPDGDAELPEELTKSFEIPHCLACGGMLKPDVVFFGENVPVQRVETVFRMVEEAEALLVLGSSLKVYSGFRFVERAARLGRPVAIVNLGETRGDELASFRLDAPLLAVLPQLSETLNLEERAIGGE